MAFYDAKIEVGNTSYIATGSVKYHSVKV